MNTAGRWATSPLVLFLFVVAIQQVVVVDSTDNDPSLAPWTALSLLRDGDTDLREVPAEVLVERPLVLPGSPAGVTFVDVEQVRAALDRAGPDAAVRDYFPIVPALLAVPAVLLAGLVGPALGMGGAEQILLDERFTPFHVLVASVVVALAVLVARSIAERLLGGSVARRRWSATAVALVLAVGTTAWSVASRALWQHGPSLLALFVALWLVLELRRVSSAGGSVANSGRIADEADAHEAVADGASDRAPGHAARPWVAPALGAVLATAVVVRPTNAIPAVALFGWVAWSSRRHLATVFAGAAVAGALWIGVAAVLGLGVPPPYYSAGRIDLSTDTPLAIAANLVSPSRGLLVSTPIVLLAVPGAWLWWRRPQDRPLVVALAVWVGGVLLAVSAFAQWWAGHTFAARFTTELLPALFGLAVPALDAVVPGRGDRTGETVSRPAGADDVGGAPASSDLEQRPGSAGPIPAWTRTRAARVVVAALAIWSVGFHTLGAWSRQTSCWNDLPVDVDDDPDRVWSLTDSQTGRALGALVTHGPRRMVAGPC